MLLLPWVASIKRHLISLVVAVAAALLVVVVVVAFVVVGGGAAAAPAAVGYVLRANVLDSFCSSTVVEHALVLSH